jgi:hypothetical protein
MSAKDQKLIAMTAHVDLEIAQAVDRIAYLRTVAAGDGKRVSRSEILGEALAMWLAAQDDAVDVA